MMSHLLLRSACWLLTAAVVMMSFNQSAIGQETPAATSFDFEPAKKLQENLSANANAIGKGIETKEPTTIDKAVTSAKSALAEYQSPTADEVNSLAAALTARLNAYSGDKASIQAKVDALEEAIASSQGIRNVTFVANRADKLRGWVAGADWQLGSSMSQFASLSEQLFQTMRTIDPVSATTSLSRVAESLTATDGYRLPLENPAVRTKLVAARASLDDKVRNDDPSSWLIAVGNSIDTLLVDQPKEDEVARQRRAAIVKRLQNIPEAMAAAVKAKAAFDKLGDSFRPRLHVIRAYYGDVYQGGNPRRNCDATETMISQCEREQKCALPEGFETKLCGFDPIPAADDRTRGVAITFSCQAGGDGVWDELAKHRSVNPDNGSDLRSPQNPARRYALMRGTQMEIRCPTDEPGAK